jgi:hypothetical protein
MQQGNRNHHDGEGLESLRRFHEEIVDLLYEAMSAGGIVTTVVERLEVLERTLNRLVAHSELVEGGDRS